MATQISTPKYNPFLQAGICPRPFSVFEWMIARKTMENRPPSSR